MRYFKTLGALALAIASPATPAMAQGVFDLGALTNSIAVGAPTTPATTATPVPASAFTFQPSLEVRKQNMANFFKGMREINADAANQMEQGLGQIDLIEAIGKAVAPMGLRSDNIVDAYTVYLISAWMTANGRADINTKAQADGTRNMVLATFSAAPDLQKLSAIDKQKMAEGLLLQAFLFDAMAQGTANDPAASAKVKTDVKAGAKAMGIDVDQFTMSENGLSRKK